MNKLSLAFTNVNEEFSRYLLKREISNLLNWFSGQILRVDPAKFDM
ncbi:hypothetical protein IBE20_08080 [Francisella tularensis subsp. novicida]|nr:hypothetical protein [Francisella tularensis]MBK2034882.1 hypothetical protein [Francisella tularensis subsp. novicida]MBK2116499.1 hypothetical protein [Francisella tularensis subsp. novicida]MBK2312593.1 hypothetical protein [Francisella tularensis subsp. novicida]MBK2316370.1 hypothetical protein [Francisella tularensis subsp. novicida]MBK2321843.1 hypothetical protein [Francisella tularensis subsp. novicida]